MLKLFCYLFILYCYLLYYVLISCDYIFAASNSKARPCHYISQQVFRHIRLHMFLTCNGILRRERRRVNPWSFLARSASLLFYTVVPSVYVPAPCFALVLREKGWLIGGDRWLFKFGLEPIPPPVFWLKVDGGKEDKGCHSFSQRCKSQRQTSKNTWAVERWFKTLQCTCLTFIPTFYSGVIVTYCCYSGLFCALYGYHILFMLTCCIWQDDLMLCRRNTHDWDDSISSALCKLQ